MQLEDYYRALRAADWNFEYANGEAHRRGRENVRRLEQESHESPLHKAMFQNMKAAGEAGAPWPTLAFFVENLPKTIACPA